MKTVKKKTKYDFCGYVTKNDLVCSDGRVIRKNAFKDCDGQTVPLVWQHDHDNPDNILGHVYLENRDDGVYGYGEFNDTAKANTAKSLVAHEDITMMSIWANHLVENASNIVHGVIQEVSLVLRGANPGAYIEDIAFAHGDYDEPADTVIIYSGIPFSKDIQHSDEPASTGSNQPKDLQTEDEPSNSEPTVEDILNTMNEQQLEVVDYLIGNAIIGDDDDEGDDEGDNNNKNKGGKEMKHNLFDSIGNSGSSDGTVVKDNSGKVLSHSDISGILEEAKTKNMSMKAAFIAHGIDKIAYLFPDHKNLNTTPEYIARDTGWVSDVMGAVHHTPFAKIRSTFADLTADEARARGYVTGDKKEEEVISLLKRETDPTTVYKLQKMDRDDIIDATDINVVAWLKSEMRFMLNEELARAYLIGDGRLASDRFKIKEDRIRPVWKEDDLFCIKHSLGILSTADRGDIAREFIRECVKSRKKYRGSGNPVLFTTEDMISECLLLTDKNGRDIYDSEEKLRTKLRVSKIITVPVMEGQTRTNEQGQKLELAAIIVNLRDYNVGADKGGEINMFDDFDIDYNKETYLIETRCSGALTKPYSAIALEIPVASEANG